jgi:hypothetical protein
MSGHFRFPSLTRSRLLLGLLLVVWLPVSACKSGRQADVQPLSQLSQSGMWPSTVDTLRQLQVSNAEASELSKARQAGLSDEGCIDLIKIARRRNKPFADGDSVATLLSSGASEQTVLALARLNQLGLWTGQAQALRLAGFSDRILLAVAGRRSQGLPILSGEKLAELKNTGVSEEGILEMIQKGVTDKEASMYIAERERVQGGHGFVYQGRRRRR